MVFEFYYHEGQDNCLILCEWTHIRSWPHLTDRQTGSSICVMLLNLLTINPTYSTHSWPLEVTRVSVYSINCQWVGIWCSYSLRHNTPSSMSIRITSIIGLTYTSTFWSISCIGVRGCLLRQALTWNCRGSKGLLLLLLLLGVWNWSYCLLLWACSQINSRTLAFCKLFTTHLLSLLVGFSQAHRLVLFVGFSWELLECI